MRLIISFILAALMVSCAAPPARSQSSYTVVASCGTPPLTLSAGAVRTGYMDTSGQICSVAPAGAGSATAANQVLQLAQETAINTLLGVQADAACATDNGTCTLAALVKRSNQRLTTINTTLGSPIQATGGTVGLAAGTAIVGKFGIDQTTPGTTNAVAPIAGQAGVQGGAGASTALTQRIAIATDANTVSLAANQSVNVAQINAVTPLMGNGATGTGSQRVTIASDNTAFSVNAALNATPSVANGNGVIIAPSSATSAALTPQTTAAAASNAVLKSSAGNLYDVTVTVGATSGWVMVFDATALPSNGATGASLKWCYPVLSNGTVGGINKIWHQPISFATGITVGFSSTACNSLTASATAFFYGGIQ